MTDLSKAVALVTGGASGIGRMLVLRLGAAGATVVVWDINEQQLDTLSTEARDNNHDVRIYRCDLASRNSIADTAARVRQEVGVVDLVINNAGIVAGRTLSNLSDEQIEQTFAVNTLSLFWVTRAFLPAMLDRNHGHIVTIASAAGIAGAAKLTDYSASKFAAFGFDDSLRAELRYLGKDVATTVVCPFFINTGMFDGVTTRFPWLLPILRPVDVVDRIIKAIRRRQPRVIMPRFVYTIWLVRLLPVAAGDRIMAFFGANQHMDQFKGRTETSNEPHKP